MILTVFLNNKAIYNRFYNETAYQHGGKSRHVYLGAT